MGKIKALVFDVGDTVFDWRTGITRAPIESLACVEPDCDLYGQAGQDNLTVRKV